MTLDYAPLAHSQRLTVSADWLDSYHADDPERFLLAGIVGRAWRDVKGANRAHAADALAYFAGTNFDADAAWLGLEPEPIRRHLKTIMASKIQFTDEQVRAMHARYMDEALSLEAVARENYISVATLHRAFKRLGLKTRPPGPTLRGRAAGRQNTARDLRQLADLLARIDELAAGGPVRVSIDIQIDPLDR